jgi:hypothetical protein
MSMILKFESWNTQMVLALFICLDVRVPDDSPQILAMEVQYWNHAGKQRP